MSEISKLIAEIKSEGILRAGNKLEQIYRLAEQADSDAQVGVELSDRLAKQLSELQQKLDAMAAENAALKQVAMDYADLADSRLSEMTANYESDCRRECYEFTNKTPATDAYLNSVRAEIVNELCIAFVQHAEMAGLADDEKVTLKECTEAVLHCAEQLRSGTHDTADKAG